MAYNEKLADRVREIISATHKITEEKKMFGGLCFMVNGKMCIGVEQERLMVRLDPVKYEEVLEEEGCKPMDFTGKIMKGYVFVDIDALNTKKKLGYWISLALDYNKIAKASKKKNKVNPSGTVALFDKLVATNPKVQRKGATNPYTSCNGNMFTHLTPEGVLAIRLPEKERQAFLKKYKTGLQEAHGIIRKEWVLVSDSLLKKTSELKPYFDISYVYAKTLKSKATSKAKK
jgi:TfoX/Sxy family transcriptional regulator of competence genes